MWVHLLDRQLARVKKNGAYEEIYLLATTTNTTQKLQNGFTFWFRKGLVARVKFRLEDSGFIIKFKRHDTKQ